MGFFDIEWREVVLGWTVTRGPRIYVFWVGPLLMHAGAQAEGVSIIGWYEVVLAAGSAATRESGLHVVWIHGQAGAVHVWHCWQSMT